MANYADAVLAKGQAIVTNKYNEPEQRRQMPTVMELALKNQHISIPDAQALRVSPLRPVDVNYFTNVVAGSAVAKAYNHTGSYGDSAKINLNYVQLVETFSLPRKIAYNSIMTYQNMFNNLYEQKWKNLRTRHDNAAIAYLLANRVQLNDATMSAQLASAGLGDYWNDTNFALELPYELRSLYIANIKNAMASRFLGTSFDVVSDLQTSLSIENFMNQGAGNFNNTSWQFADCNFSRSQVSLDSNYSSGVSLVMPQGAFAGLNWNEGLNVKGDLNDEYGSIGILTTAPDPFGSGAIADLSMYTQRADTSANTYGGSTEDIVDQWELTLTIGYAIPPLNTSSDSVVMEIVQMPQVP